MNDIKSNILVEFRVSNYKSFKEMAEFSLVATKDKTNEKGSVSIIDGERILRCAAIYGANGSGKSNFISALLYMRFLISFYNRKGAEWGEEEQTYRLDQTSQKKPIYFEAIFFNEGVRYRYGFEIKQKTIVSEWLFVLSSSRETKLFTREGSVIEFGRNFKEGKAIKTVRPERLLLTIIAEVDNKSISQSIVDWFGYTNMASGIYSGIGYTEHVLEHHGGDDKQKILNLLHRFDVQIADIFINPERADAIDEDDVLIIMRNVYKGSEIVGQEKFLLSDESDGTRRLVGLAGYLVEALDHGNPIIIDEIEAKLHPLVTRTIIELFNDPEFNDNNSQIVFTTHDTNLLNGHALRRDQIWFTEKDRFGASHIYSLADYKEKPRKDVSHEKNYIKGRYGGIPFIGDINEVLR
jgi:AAA15 family ATPase/GTPase